MCMYSDERFRRGNRKRQTNGLAADVYSGVYLPEAEAWMLPRNMLTGIMGAAKAEPEPPEVR